VIATATGTAASLLFSGAARIAVWSALTLAISVTSGLGYDAVTDRICGQGHEPVQARPRHGPGPPQPARQAGDSPDGPA
jgi:hypothetical protein